MIKSEKFEKVEKVGGMITPNFVTFSENPNFNFKDKSSLQCEI